MTFQGAPTSPPPSAWYAMMNVCSRRSPKANDDGINKSADKPNNNCSKSKRELGLAEVTMQCMCVCVSAVHECMYRGQLTRRAAAFVCRHYATAHWVAFDLAWPPCESNESDLHQVAIPLSDYAIVLYPAHTYLHTCTYVCMCLECTCSVIGTVAPQAPPWWNLFARTLFLTLCCSVSMRPLLCVLL